MKLARFLLRRGLFLWGGVIAGGTLFLGGFLLGDKKPDPLPSFHDIRINHVSHFTDLVDPGHPAVRSLARRLQNPEEAYLFVRDRVLFNPALPAGPPHETLEYGAGSCLAKAGLLVSLYRAQGIPHRSIRVVVGRVTVGDRAVDHAWVDLEHRDGCLQQDPTDLLGRFSFSSFPDRSFSRAFVEEERFCFNDKGFAVVSQLNQMRDGVPEEMSGTP